jgi:hypothetical protein
MGYSGTESRVRNINAMQESALRLEYIGLSESDMLSFLTHYVNSSGSYGAFTLPSATFSGVSSASDYTLTGYLWRYEDAPSVEDLPCGGHNVSVALVSVIPEGAFADGVELEITISFSAPTPVSARGASLELLMQLKPGVAAGFSPGTGPGAALTIAAAITGGAATAAAVVAGMTATVTVSLSAGTASGQGSASGITATVTVSLAVAVDADGYFDDVSLLLKFEGSSIVDSSSNTLTVSTNGNPAISTTQKKFGSSSLFVNGPVVATQDYISVAASSLFNVGLGASFTVELWFRASSNTTNGGGIVGQRTGFQYVPFVIQQANRNLQWLISNAAANGWHSTSTSTGNLITAGTWHFLLLVGDGSNLYLRLDGTQILTTTQPNWSSANRQLVIGSSGSSEDYYGYVDEARFTLGVARSNTVPTAAFPTTSAGATGEASATGMTATVTVSLDPGAASV